MAWPQAPFPASLDPIFLLLSRIGEWVPHANAIGALGGHSCKKPDPPRTSSTPRITTFPPVPITCDAVRNKCREMLTLALQTDHDHEAVGVDCEHLSAQIEECIFLDVGNTDMKYKNRVRSRISNLKDAKNPGLRRNVLCGAITPQQIAVMTSEEMASDELKEIRKAMTKEAIREHQMARTGGTQTDLFTCSKCRKKNCTYTQVQTRSSDEPMTTYVVCNECGNRWKQLEGPTQWVLCFIGPIR
uniref:transcription elongation factor A protein 2 isoform X9 n=1 Tax=Myodes glareolus TaxID=447135 RepID=UPI00202020DD|nr:transcription elongation factor A protein 2 isoform X9 [Myodes glareolus]